jgi:hypothetical protein
MKKLLLTLLLLALPAVGDVTITNTYTDGQAARITRAMQRVNKATCAYRGLPANCTTTQVREQFCKTNGFGGQPILDVNGNVIGTTPLVSDCNGATQFIVYGNITQFDKRTLLEKIAEWQTQEEAEDRAAAKAAWDAKTQAQKDALCPSFGLTAPCTPF